MVIIITLIIAVLAGVYAYRYLRASIGKKTTNVIYLSCAIVSVIYALSENIMEANGLFSIIKSIAVVILFYTAATIPLCIVALMEDIFHLAQTQLLRKKRSHRSNVMFIIATTMAGAGIFSIIYGMTVTKTDWKVYPLEMYSQRIPKSFDSLKIVQISDMHLGSFSAGDKNIPRAIEMINALKPDIILFTGDILNNNTREVKPWLGELKKLHATYGKYAVIGNHDYCEYDRDLNEQGRASQMDSLKKYYKITDFTLLNNEHRAITINGENIYIAGVENWGTGPFPARGDIQKATKDIPQGHYIILMSHDPDHFKHIISSYPQMIDLTLSGHTHAMQMGIELSDKIRWSPIQYRSKYWAGRYDENGRTLYVNRGFGYHFFPGRMGIRPEITLITLHHAEK
ncbi:MAG: metallophosphoesterase [Flavobacteriales bacterium]|nr:metallophosphoesterase [Flavobacteriales bacterium]